MYVTKTKGLVSVLNYSSLIPKYKQEKQINDFKLIYFKVYPEIVGWALIYIKVYITTYLCER
jgi:hypothetical protein